MLLIHRNPQPRFPVPVCNSLELPRISVPDPMVPYVRSYSQPRAFDPDYHTNGAQLAASHPHGSSVPLPTPESSRSTSPQYTPRVIDTKPTRMPKVAGLAPTSSSSSRSPIQPSSINTVINNPIALATDVHCPSLPRSCSHSITASMSLCG
jgi:hypothetical protein